MNPTKLFFTADQHFGAHHHAVTHREGFRDTAHMDEVLIQTWNLRVPKEGGHVFCLGDFSMSKGERTSEILEQLNGRKYMVIGNHDKGLNLRNKAYFEWIKPYHEQRVDWGEDKFKLVLCHYAFRSWNRQHHGAWNLHGHSHNHLPRVPAQLDVGVDSARVRLGMWSPFSFQDVMSILVGEQAICEDHHKPPTGSSSRGNSDTL